MSRFVAGCIIVAACLWVAACSGGSDAKTTAAPAGGKTAAASTDGGGASALGDLSTTVDLSLGGQGYPLTMKAPKGAQATRPGGEVVSVQGGSFGADVFKLDTPFNGRARRSNRRPRPASS